MVLPLILGGVGIGMGIIGSIVAASGAGETDEQARVRGMYRDLAMGKGPSYATELIKAQGAIAQRRMFGQAMGAQAANPNAAVREAMMQGSEMQRDLIGQAAAIRAQEQLAAYQGWAGMANERQRAEQQKAAAWGAMFSGAGAGLTAMAGSGMFGGGGGASAATKSAGGGVGGGPSFIGGASAPLGMAQPTPPSWPSLPPGGYMYTAPVQAPAMTSYGPQATYQPQAPPPSSQYNMVQSMRASQGFPAGR